ncbi:MAG: virulence RhuM family protein [Candidatus Peribacteraceae bacterium]|nr:virulence RhuM family protein [Candidatus Peribacteraceae bacterium]
MPALRQKAVHPMGEVIVYESAKGKTQVEVRLQKESLWLSLQQMARLFGRDKSVISRHIQNILKDKELERKSVVANYATTAEDGKNYNVDYYNLDMIISVGYRVNSKQGTQFRIWATQILKQHIVKGFTINEKRLKEQQTIRIKELEKAVTSLQKALLIAKK